MKKRISLILAAALCLCLFTGAACDHDWQRLEEVGPMVCSKCSADECEAFGHSFQEWEVNGKTMNAWCTVCYQNIVEDFDPQTVGEHRLIGQWEATTIIIGDTELNLTDLGGMMSITVIFNEDHRLSVDSNILLGDASGGGDIASSNTGTWEFESYDEEDVDPYIPSLGKQEAYSFKVLMDVPESLTFDAEIEGQDEYNSYVLYSSKIEAYDRLVQVQAMSDSYTVVSFEKVGAPVVSYNVNDEDIVELDAEGSFAELLPGSWYADEYSNGYIYIPLAENEKIELNIVDDGSLSFITGGNAVGGRWTLGEAEEIMGMKMCAVNITLDDGSELVFSFNGGISGSTPLLSIDEDSKNTLVFFEA